MALARFWDGFASTLQFVNFKWKMFMWRSRHVLHRLHKRHRGIIPRIYEVQQMLSLLLKFDQKRCHSMAMPQWSTLVTNSYCYTFRWIYCSPKGVSEVDGVLQFHLTMYVNVQVRFWNWFDFWFLSWSNMWILLKIKWNVT